MNVTTFDNVINKQIKRCTDILLIKAKEYATEDRLHNFKVAATLEGCSLQKALAGMMAKHTVSIYDMCRSDVDYSITYCCSGRLLRKGL